MSFFQMARPSANDQVDSPYAWLRLMVTLAIMALGASGMYVVPVVLPEVQAEFGVSRADASLPYTLVMLGFGLGGLLMGRLADRYGIWLPLLLGAAGLGLGFGGAALTVNIQQFSWVHGLLIGLLGCSATFAPLLADTTQWFARRRGIAVAICASGNYLGGALWPPIVQHFVQSYGWRATYTGMAIVIGLSIAALALLMRRPTPVSVLKTDPLSGKPSPDKAFQKPFGLSSAHALVLLSIASVSCCVAMSMPQVHIVAYCTDLGYGAARGAEMLSLMMATGVISRLISGAICDRIGGLRTLLLGSGLQGVALLFFLPFDGMVSLYLIAAMFGLFQGGIVPSYAIIVRENFPPQNTGLQVGLLIMGTMFGMALGGWMSGKIFDISGSYQAAFANGIAWNLLNFGIAFYLLRRSLRDKRSPTLQPAAH
ncbi:MAG: MFS transporter [Hylemonella sp.]